MRGRSETQIVRRLNLATEVRGALKRGTDLLCRGSNLI
jgi:hypothetical protein